MRSGLYRNLLLLSAIICLTGATITPILYGATNSIKAIEIVYPKQPDRDKILSKYRIASLFFIENRGQFPEEVLFQIHANGATLYLCKDKVVTILTKIEKKNASNISFREPSRYLGDVKVKRAKIVAHFEGANDNVKVSGEGLLQHYSNYFIGNDPRKWYTHVPHYREVIYYDIYPGIDLRYCIMNNSLKYDFIVHPGADPSVIRIRYEGMENLKITSDGDIEITTSLGTIYEKAPLIYQKLNNEIINLHGRYILLESDVFGFQVEKNYDLSSDLIIDPELVYSTYLGGMLGDNGFGDIAVDSKGCVYVTGETTSSDFPTVNAYDGSFNGFLDCFITKLSPSGNSLIYSTYLGGMGCDGGYAIAIDDNGYAYITGYTSSDDFPTVNACNDIYNGYTDCFIAKLSPYGDSLIYSTYLGGTNYDEGRSIAIDSSSCAYVVVWTNSTDLPTANAYDDDFNGCWDCFIAKLSPSGSSFIYSTYMGGKEWDEGFDIAVDNNCCAYVTGWTASPDFPVVNAYDGNLNCDDCFIVKFPPSGDSLIYSTYLGGSDSEIGFAVAVDDNGCAYVTGATDSRDFPTVNAYDDGYNGGDGDGFIVKLSSSGDSLVYSTYMGGSNCDVGRAIAIDENGCAYISGWTTSDDFPTMNAYDDSYNGGLDCLVAKLSHSGDTLIYSTYLGGKNRDESCAIAVDADGYIYITGWTNSTDFPTVNAYDDRLDGGSDCFVVKFSLLNIDIIKPKRGLYINNKRITNFFVPLVVGRIDIEMGAVDASVVSRVELYINGILRANLTSEPYIYTWSEQTFGRHEIKAIAYDKSGRSMIAREWVWKFL